MTIREYDVQNDAAPVASLLTNNTLEPITAEQHAEDVAHYPKGQPIKRYVGLLDGQIVGYVRAGQYAPNPKHSFGIQPIVAKEARDRGLGSALYDKALEYLQTFAPLVMLSIADESDGAGIRFAEKRGFKPIANLFNSYLDLTKFDAAGHTDAFRLPTSQGYEFTSLANMTLDEPTRKKFYHQFLKAFSGTPGEEYFGLEEWEDFNKVVFESKSLDAAGYGVALYKGEFVGFSDVIKTEAAKEGDMFTGFTGVVPEHRRKGLAYAMKVKMIEYCIELGGRQLKTENDSRNAPMLKINRKLGFIEHPGEVIFVKDLERVD
jgi:GNAT superfamily N-acetyltransferase